MLAMTPSDETEPCQKPDLAANLQPMGISEVIITKDTLSKECASVLEDAGMTSGGSTPHICSSAKGST